MYKALILLHLLLFTSGVKGQQSIIMEGGARFSLLTPHIVRLEYDSTRRFVDSRSFIAVNRSLSPVAFSQKRNGKWLTIKTSVMEIRYKPGKGGFTKENLSILYYGSPQFIWKPGMKNIRNLKGTFRTLDGLNGDTHVDETIPKEFEPGLISRDGWSLIDDTNIFYSIIAAGAGSRNGIIKRPTGICWPMD